MVYLYRNWLVLSALGALTFIRLQLVFAEPATRVSTALSTAPVVATAAALVRVVRFALTYLTHVEPAADNNVVVESTRDLNERKLRITVVVSCLRQKRPVKMNPHVPTSTSSTEPSH